MNSEELEELTADFPEGWRLGKDADGAWIVEAPAPAYPAVSGLFGVPQWTTIATAATLLEAITLAREATYDCPTYRCTRERPFVGAHHHKLRPLSWMEKLR